MPEQRTPPPRLPEVKDLPRLLAAELDDGEEVEGFVSKPATSLGENYGSTMLALDITIKKKGDEAAARRHLHAFCKMLPEDPERRVIFSVEVTFFKELEMYTLAIPALVQLQRDNGVPEEDLLSHLVPRCYGGRASLVGAEVDEDAAILLEDMRQRGFAPGNRRTGLSLEHAKLVLKKLAVFHALPVALRNKKPKVYEDTVLRACLDFRMAANAPEDAMGDMAKFRQCILHNVQKSAKAAAYLDVIRRIGEETKMGKDEELPPIREPYASMLHNDLWTNNILLQNDPNGGPSQVAFIDFQVTRINSPFKDLVFFLFTSVDIDATANHLDELVELYHDSFCRCLSQVGVDTTPFSLAAAWEEINALAQTELFHSLFMLRWITAEPEVIRANPGTFMYMEELGGEAYSRKVEHIVLQYAKRGWLS